MVNIVELLINEINISEQLLCEYQSSQQACKEDSVFVNIYRWKNWLQVYWHKVNNVPTK